LARAELPYFLQSLAISRPSGACHTLRREIFFLEIEMQDLSLAVEMTQYVFRCGGGKDI
jgi:hypothetical protein